MIHHYRLRVCCYCVSVVVAVVFYAYSKLRRPLPRREAEEVEDRKTGCIKKWVGEARGKQVIVRKEERMLRPQLDEKREEEEEKKFSYLII